MLFQECQRLRVELLDLLVDRRMRAPLEDDKLTILDAACHPAGKARRGRHVVAAESDLRRRLDLAEVCLRIMGDHGVRCLEERLQRLRRAAPNELGQRAELIMLLQIAG